MTRDARERKNSLAPSLAPSNVTTQASLYTDAASEIASSSASLHTIRGNALEQENDTISVFTDANDFTRSHSSLAIVSDPQSSHPQATPAPLEMSNFDNEQQISATQGNPSALTIRPAAASVTPLPLVTALPEAAAATMADSQIPKLSPAAHDEKLLSASPSEVSTRDEKMNEKHTAGSSKSNEEDPEMKGLSPEQKRIIMEQVYVVSLRQSNPSADSVDSSSQEVKNTVTFRHLWRFSTKLELFYNFIGLIGAIVAGAANPLQTVIFGK